MLIIQYVLYGLAGLLLAVIIFKKPNYFWPGLIFSLVLSAGIMVGGYCFIDEYFLLCILSGATLRIIKNKGRIDYKPASIYQAVFILMAIYMVIQGFRGVFALQDLRILRWVVYYVALGLLMLILSGGFFPIPSLRVISLFVCLAGISFFILYLGYGIACEYISNINSFAVQGTEWSGSAYAVFIAVIVLVASLFLLNDKTRYKYIGWFTWLLVLPVAFYYKSRAACWLVFSLALLSATAMRLKKSLILIVCSLAMFLFLQDYLYSHSLFYNRNKVNNFIVDYRGRVIQDRETTTTTAAKSVVARQKRNVGTPARRAAPKRLARWAMDPGDKRLDQDRAIHLIAAAVAVSENWRSFLFGYGLHSSHYVMGRYLKPLYEQYMPMAKLGDTVWTTGFSAILIETGWLGVILLLLNFFFCGRLIFTYTDWKPKTYRYILLFSLALVLLWLFVSNIQDIVLFYFLIMPSGLFTQLAIKAKEEKGRLREAV